VERYWSVRWDRTGRPPHRSEVLSHPSVNLSVESGSEPRFGHVLPAVLVHGVTPRRSTIDLAGTGRVTAAKFRPGGWVALGGRLPGRATVAPLGTALGLDAARLLVAVLGSMSTRSLQRLFAGYVGLSPKAVLARYRLQDAAATIDAGGVGDLAGLAASLGWFDQAHFSRDFRAVTGTTPSAYLRRARAAQDTG
jgi:AraC-like DNA-binding protein